MHEDKLAPENLAKYTALMLPNTALLSDEQCRQLRAYVDARRVAAGDVRNQPVQRAQRAAARISAWPMFSAFTRPARSSARTGNAYLARIEKQHEILAGFTNTALDSRRGESRARGAGGWPGADGGARLRGVPAGAVVSGAGAHQRAGGGDAAERARAGWLYFPGDIERTMWKSGHTDLARLLQNSIRWVAGGNPPVTVEGEGVIETFAWETQAGFAVHVLNYTNPAMHRGWLRNFYPIGAQKVRMTLPEGRRVTRVELLRAERQIPFVAGAGTVEFTIPRVVDYEVGAIYAA